MKLKLADIFFSKDILEKLGKDKIEDGITVYKLLENIKVINSKLSSIEETRNSLVNQYGKEDEKNLVEVLPENLEKFSNEFNAVLSQEIEIDILTLNPAKINGYSALELLPIGWMFKLEDV